MGKTIKALKRNRKKYQEGGEVLSPEELMRQAGQEAMDIFNAEQAAKNNEVQPALLEQTEEALAGPPADVPVVTAEPKPAPTSLLETTAAPAPVATPAPPEPVAPVYDPAKDGDLRMWAIGQQLNVTPEMVKSSVDYTSSLSGGNDRTAIQAAKDKLKQEFPEAYAQAFPAAPPTPAQPAIPAYNPAQDLFKYAFDNRVPMTVELLQRRKQWLGQSGGDMDAFFEEAKKQAPTLYAEVFPERVAAEQVSEPAEKAAVLAEEPAVPVQSDLSLALAQYEPIDVAAKFPPNMGTPQGTVNQAIQNSQLDFNRLQGLLSFSGKTLTYNPEVSSQNFVFNSDSPPPISTDYRNEENYKTAIDKWNQAQGLALISNHRDEINKSNLMENGAVIEIGSQLPLATKVAMYQISVEKAAGNLPDTPPKTVFKRGDPAPVPLDYGWQEMQAYNEAAKNWNEVNSDPVVIPELNPTTKRREFNLSNPPAFLDNPINFRGKKDPNQELTELGEFPQPSDYANKQAYLTAVANYNTFAGRAYDQKPPKDPEVRTALGLGQGAIIIPNVDEIQDNFFFKEENYNKFLAKELQGPLTFSKGDPKPQYNEYPTPNHYLSAVRAWNTANISDYEKFASKQARLNSILKADKQAIEVYDSERNNRVIYPSQYNAPNFDKELIALPIDGVMPNWRNAEVPEVTKDSEIDYSLLDSLIPVSVDEIRVNGPDDVEFKEAVEVLKFVTLESARNRIEKLYDQKELLNSPGGNIQAETMQLYKPPVIPEPSAPYNGHPPGSHAHRMFELEIAKNKAQYLLYLQNQAVYDAAVSIRDQYLSENEAARIKAEEDRIAKEEAAKEAETPEDTGLDTVDITEPEDSLLDPVETPEDTDSLLDPVDTPVETPVETPVDEGPSQEEIDAAKAEAERKAAEEAAALQAQREKVQAEKDRQASFSATDISNREREIKEYFRSNLLNESDEVISADKVMSSPFWNQQEFLPTDRKPIIEYYPSEEAFETALTNYEFAKANPSPYLANVLKNHVEKEMPKPIVYTQEDAPALQEHFQNKTGYGTYYYFSRTYPVEPAQYMFETEAEYKDALMNLQVVKLTRELEGKEFNVAKAPVIQGYVFEPDPAKEAAYLEKTKPYRNAKYFTTVQDRIHQGNGNDEGSMIDASFRYLLNLKLKLGVDEIPPYEPIAQAEEIPSFVDGGAQDSLLDQQPTQEPEQLIPSIDSQYDENGVWQGAEPLDLLRLAVNEPFEGMPENFDRMNPTPEQAALYDVDGSGKISSRDALDVVRNYYDKGTLKGYMLALRPEEREEMRPYIEGLVGADLEDYGLLPEAPQPDDSILDTPADTDEVADSTVPELNVEGHTFQSEYPDNYNTLSPSEKAQIYLPVNGQTPNWSIDYPEPTLDSARDYRYLDAITVDGASKQITDTYKDTIQSLYVQRDMIKNGATPELINPENMFPLAVPPGAYPATGSDEDKAIWMSRTAANKVKDHAMALYNINQEQLNNRQAPVVDDTPDVNPDDFDNDDDFIDAINDNIDAETPADDVISTITPMNEADKTNALIGIGLDIKHLDFDSSFGSKLNKAEVFRKQYEDKAQDLYDEYLPYISGDVSDIPPSVKIVEDPGENPHTETFNDPNAYIAHQHQIANYKMYLYEQALYDNAVALYEERRQQTQEPNYDDYDNDDDFIDAINNNIDAETPEDTSGVDVMDITDYDSKIQELEGLFKNFHNESQLMNRYTPKFKEIYDKYAVYLSGEISDIPPAIESEDVQDPGTIYDRDSYSAKALETLMIQAADSKLHKYEQDLYNNALAIYEQSTGANQMADTNNQDATTSRREASSAVSLENRDASGAPRELKYQNPTVSDTPQVGTEDVSKLSTFTTPDKVQAVSTGDDVTGATASGATASKTVDPDTGLPALQAELTDKVTGPDADSAPSGVSYTASTMDTPVTATAATTPGLTKTASATGATAASITAATRDTEAETAATATAATQTLSENSVATAVTAFDSVRNTKSFEALKGIAETRRETMEADPEYIEALDTLSGEELQAKLQDIPSVKSYLRAESTMLKMLENAGAKKIAEVEGPAVASTYKASTISPEDLIELTTIAQDRGVDITELDEYKITKVRTAQTATAATGTATTLGTAPTAEAAKAAQVEATAIEMAGTTTIEDTPEYKKAAERTAQTAEAATGTAAEIDLTGISVDFEEREAITGTAPQGTAAEIGGVPTFEAAQMQATTAEARTLNATEMLAVTASLPEETAAAIAQNPASVEAAIDSGEDPKVTAAVAALPPEALVSAQMETLLAGMEDGETPTWARPAVDAVDAAMARRGLSASTVGRDALFNAIIQSALPMAQSNAQALQARAAQNLSNQQQASLAQAQNIMTIRMQNLANSQLAASQSAQMAQEIAVKQSTFDQQAAMLSAEQEQQTALVNTQNAQRTAEINAQQQQQAAIAQFTEAAKLDYQNLQALNAASAANLNAEQQAKLKAYDAQVARLVRQAELQQDIEKANLSAALTVEMQNLTEQNAAARDTMSATNQERLTNLQTLIDLRKTNATLAQQMDMANLTNEQQVELAVLQDKAATDAANFTADNQFRLTELNNKVARSVRQAELDQRIAEINLDAALKLELTELSEMNATNRANMSAEQQTRLANLNTLIDFKKTNATLTQQMELANLSNEQQISLANLSEKAAADSQNFTEANRFELQRLTTAAQLLSSNEQLRMNADMAKLSTEERVALANLTAKNNFDAASMSAENTAELQRYERQMAAAQVNAQLAQQMGLQELSNAQQAAMFNAQVNSNLDFKAFDAAQQVELANSAFMQTMTINEFNAEQQAAIQNATMLTQVNLAGADQATKLAVTNASNFLQMDMANLSNKQQIAVLNAQIEQQRLISNISADNAAAQFSAANQQQADLFMANLGVEIEKYNTSAMIAREQFNATEKNRQAAIDAGNELEASRLTAQLETDISKFNAQQELAREQWNAANAQAVEQSNIQWRRQANLADTAAQNAANQQNAQIAFNLTSQEQTQLWQQLRDEAAYIRQSYENDEQRKAQMLATAIGNTDVRHTPVNHFKEILAIDL